MQPFNPPVAEAPKPMASAKNARNGVGTDSPDGQGLLESSSASIGVASASEPPSGSGLPSGAEPSSPISTSGNGRSPSTTSRLALQPQKRLNINGPTTSRRTDTT